MIVVDHFCGGGGESTGIAQALDELGMKFELHAHNHWERAIETHSMNHPDAIHRQQKIEDLDPVRCVKGNRVALMWASPECTHHSVARGGRPCSDQSRSTAMSVIKWAQELYIERIIVENVPEFLNWGPIGSRGRPLKSKRGATFRAWKGMLESLGYRVEWRILRAADYGDPTTRRRLFVQAVRGNKKICWPDPTHSDHPEIKNHKPWVPAREIIDWSVESQSIFTRRRPLAAATLKRIEIGVQRYWGEWAEPFLCVLRGTGGVRDINVPVPTVTAGGNHLGLVEPFITIHRGQSLTRAIKQPLPTVSCGGIHAGLIEPFIIANGHRSSVRVKPIEKPLSTVVTKAEHCLVEPLVMEYYGNGECSPVSKPLRTVTTRDRFALIQGTYALDIRFRMLQPHELAAAQGFPSDYWFSGNKADQVRQIGNAVPPGLARALTKAAFAV